MLFKFVFLCLFWRFVPRESEIFEKNGWTRSKVEKENKCSLFLVFHYHNKICVLLHPKLRHAQRLGMSVEFTLSLVCLRLLLLCLQVVKIDPRIFTTIL